MRRSTKAFFLILGLAAAWLTFRIDFQSALVTERIVMESPRPIFEPAQEAQQLSMPCTYLQIKRFDHEPVSARNTRCTGADRSE